MNSPELLTIIVVLTALCFDFVNGFHDASNSIATIVATRVLRPRLAVLWAGFFNFAALFLFGTAVAKTVGSGMIALESVTSTVILCGLLGAIFWGLITWWLGLPTSSSHALLGGYAGAAMMNSALTKGMSTFYDPIITNGWLRMIVFIIIAPVMGIVIAYFLMKISILASKFSTDRRRTDRIFGVMQLASSAFLSLMHGANDAQKTAGIIGSALVAGGFYKEFTLPMGVLYASYSIMGLGTFFGGWRIVNTMGRKLTRLRPNGGFSAESAAAAAIGVATLLGLPVSTTHATTGAILGVGTARRRKSVRWNVAQNIVFAWILTIPAAAAMGGVMMVVAALVER
jgi:PiT family inorganic phosphate transporter